MEVTERSNLVQKPSGIKPPQIRTTKLKQISENAVNPSTSNTVTTFSHRSTSNTVITSSRILPRRSKSSANIQLIVNKSKVLPKTSNKVQCFGSTVSKTAHKRKAEKLDDEVKPKIVKQAKIPDWDYKGRYNQLREKFIVINEEHKKQCNKLEEVNLLEENYKIQISGLNEVVSSLTKECEDFKQNLEQLKSNNDVICEENEKLIKENKLLISKVDNLRKNQLHLQREHDELINNHDTLKIEYNKKLDENEFFSSNLELSTKKITELTEENLYLRKDVHNGEVIRRKLHNTIQDLKGNIRVFCRVRPPINTEEEERLQCVINVVDEKTIEIRKSRESISAISGKPTDIKAEFTLDKVFGSRCSQEEVFEDLAQLVQSALDGYDVCVFAYGQTGSGKTYTMQGEENSEHTGVIPRTVDLIFNSTSNLKRTGWTYDISASFLEIYNENVRDLLNPNPIQNLEIRYNEGKGTTVRNLSIQKLNSAEELKNVMAIAQKNRAVAATNFNEHSSRSHAVTKIYLHGINQEANVSYTGSINLVDLAGSESAKTSSNERLLETKNINKSLSTLGSVMLALYNKEKHIPYRNSKLTYLLQSCLGGNSKTLMVVNIAPFEECYVETINSLRFAAKVKEVKMSAKRNKIIL